MKKKALLFPLISLLAIPFALADISNTLYSVWWKILSLGNLSFLEMSDGSIVSAFVRLMIWLLMFTLFFAVIRGNKDTAPMKYFTKGQTMVVAAIIATISAVFMPSDVLMATGGTWATIISLILIGGPIIVLGYLLTKIPGEGEDTRGTVLLKIAICFILLWILTAMKYHLGGLGGYY